LNTPPENTALTNYNIEHHITDPSLINPQTDHNLEFNHPDLSEIDVARSELRDLMRQNASNLYDLLHKLHDSNLLPELDIPQLLSSLKQVDVFLHKPSFVIGFAGGFNAGKSMLINALLGQQLLKDGAVPTTSTVTRILACPPNREQIRIEFFTPEQFEALFEQYLEDFAWLYQHTTNKPLKHGREQLTELLDDIKYLREQMEAAEWNERIRSLDSFYDLIVAYINHQHLLSEQPIIETLNRKTLNTYTTKSDNSVAPLVREVQISLHHPMLAQGSQLIDLPGLGSPDPRDEEITIQALRGEPHNEKRECDAVIHVMDSLSPFRSGEDRLFQIYRKVWGESFARRVFLVTSRWSKLERQNADEMVAVAQSIQKITERYGIDRHKVFIVDGRIGLQNDPSSPHHQQERTQEELETNPQLMAELEKCLLPSGNNLFHTTLQVMSNGNIPAFREALRYYLATHKEYLHLNDALRLLENILNKIQRTASLQLPPLEQIEDDEQQFIDQCRDDFDRNLRQIRQRAHTEIPNFLQTLLQSDTLPHDFSSLCENLYRSITQYIEQHTSEYLEQMMITNQLQQAGPLIAPIPWENFRFIFQQAIRRLEIEIQQFCAAISSQSIEKYRHFLFDELALLPLVERAFGNDNNGRDILLSFQKLLQQLERDLQLIATNLNRVFFYEYSDLFHRRDNNDTLIDIREELYEHLENNDLSPSSASRTTRWLLRHKMEHHFRKLSIFLPLCFLQQLQDTHRHIDELIEKSSYSLRHAYIQRLDRRDVGEEVDRLRHQYRQIRSCLEQLQQLRSQTSQARQLLQRE
jgi:GTP-binding protein EngB required for normal cell division